MAERRLGPGWRNPPAPDFPKDQSRVINSPYPPRVQQDDLSPSAQALGLSPQPANFGQEMSMDEQERLKQLMKASAAAYDLGVR